MPAAASVVAGAAAAGDRDELDLYHPELGRWCRAANADQAAVLAESGWVAATDLAAPRGDETPGDEPADPQEA